MPLPLPGLNSEQQECVRHMGSPLLIFAGAGTGKTRVIVAKIASLIADHGYPASSLLAVTFTNKSCEEMRRRVADLIGPERTRGITVSTFHALGCSILREHITRIGYNSKFLIYAEDEQLSALARIAEECGVSETLPPRLLSWTIQKVKNGGSPAGQPPLIRDIHQRYEEHLRNYNAVDFDDLLLKPIEIMEKHPVVREQYRKKFRYVLIDEYQDTNPVQYRLIRLILNPRNDICAVGDDDQSIYSWRGSDLSIILNFQKDFPDARTVHLVRNYRSTPTILAAAGAVVSRNAGRVPKELVSPREPGEKLLLDICDGEEDEALRIRARLREIREETGRPWSDCAVIFRTNFQSRPFELAFRSAGIPYRLIGGREFFDRKEIRDCLAYLKVLANPRDSLNLVRIINTPRRGLGDTSVRTALDFAEQHELPLFNVVTEKTGALGLKPSCRKAMESLGTLLSSYRERFLSRTPLHETLRQFIDDAGFPAHFMEESKNEEQADWKMKNLSELANHIRLFQDQNEGSGLFDYLNRIALLSETDEEKEERTGETDRVTLLTAHASKGLEFGTVFVTGLEDGLFPHRKSTEENDEALDEERRLFYVAMTRAKDRLILTSCRQRRVFGKETERVLSPFVMEIPDTFIRKPPPPGSPEAQEQKKAEFQSFLNRIEKGRQGGPVSG